MSLDALPKTRAVLERGCEDGLHLGAQLYVSRGGVVDAGAETVCDASIGDAGAGEPLTTDHLMLWLSAGKPVAALSVLTACQPSSHSVHQLRLDDPVAEHLPAFAAGGKERVTVRHLLTHTGGFPDVDSGYPAETWQESLAKVCAAPLADDWQVGRTAGYHPKSSWFVLGELARLFAPPTSISGKGTAETFEQAVRASVIDRVTGFFRGVVDEDLSCGLTYTVSEGDGRPVCPMYRRKGRQLEETELQDERHRARVSPGSSLWGTARDLGMFYEYLLTVGSTTVVTPALEAFVVEAMTARHRVGEFDRTLGHVVDFGLGVILDSNRYGADTVPYGYGPHCSPRTFGHGGSQSSIAFCDPEHDLVVAWATNGMCGEPKHQRRNRAINAAIYEDLGLA